MPSPFPGMDPYLERPDLWADVHNSLIADLRNELAPQLLPRYYVSLEERTYLAEPGELSFVSRPDVTVVGPTAPPAPERVQPANGVTLLEPVPVELPMSDPVRETYLEVRSAEDNAVITVLEILSPANKRSGEGRRQYERKRLQILDTFTHLVEIDLLRAGEPMPMRGANIQSDYRILVSRAERRPRADLLPFDIRNPIPAFYLPLQPGDDEPLVDLNRLLNTLYDRVGYGLRTNYQELATPALEGEDAAWADALLREAGLR